MWRVAQYLLQMMYAALPVGLACWALLRRKQPGRRGFIVSLVLIAIGGTAIGVMLALMNGRLFGGAISLWEGIKLVYFIIGALCLLKLIDMGLFRISCRFARVRLDAWKRPLRPNSWRTLSALLAQRVLMLLIGIPYILALLMVYRPRVEFDGDPSKVGLQFARAEFVSTDGVSLSGWWIARAAKPNMLDAEVAEQWGKRTVILCHGVGGGKESRLEFARYLAINGFNVLLFDFRGHGQSGGNFVSFGDRERQDVLAAIAWVKGNHAGECTRLVGIGWNSGAAALLAASADPQWGKSLDGLVLYEPYGEFNQVVKAVAKESLPNSVAWLMDHVALPLADLHAGTRLGSFAPASAAAALWPRPMLVVHGRGQTFIPVTESMQVFRSGNFPKEQFWPADNYDAERRRLRKIHNQSGVLTEMFRSYMGTSQSVSDDAGVRYRTLRFLREVEEMNVL